MTPRTRRRGGVVPWSRREPGCQPPMVVAVAPVLSGTTESEESDTVVAKFSHATAVSAAVELDRRQKA